MHRPFIEGDGGGYYLIEGSIRDEEFTIHCQRKTWEECRTFAKGIVTDEDRKKKRHFTIMKFESGIFFFDWASHRNKSA